MSIQGQLNREAINMLPLCREFLKEIGYSNYSAGLLQRISNSFTPLDQMTAKQISDFDAEQLNYLKKLKEHNSEA